MHRIPFCLALTLVVLCVPQARAQQNQASPHVGYVYPAGGRQGETLRVKVGGQSLNDVAKAHISGQGVHVKFIELINPMTQMQANQLRDKAKALQDRMLAAAQSAGRPARPRAGQRDKPSAAKPANPSVDKTGVLPADKLGPLTAEERQTLLDIRKKLTKFYTNPPIPAIAQTVILEVSIDSDAAPGRRDIRLMGPRGLTNPLVFCVGQLPEVVKQEKPDDIPPQQALRKLRAQAGPDTSAQPAVEITLPVTVNGQILSGQVDRYRFAAKQGRQIVVEVSAQQLIPYLADAVPGWFQAAVAVTDAEGRELAYAGAYRFHPDPVLHFEVPHDGEYLVEIHDSVFRGREDFVYRMSIGELPFATRIFPLGGKAGAPTVVEAEGWNIPATSIAQPTLGKLPGVYPAALPGLPMMNRLPLAIDDLPECLEQEPNDRPETAQRLTLPVIVNGRIDHPGDRDVFRMEGRAGQVIVAEVRARRLDSPLDSVLKLTDASGRQLAFNDDCVDAGCGLLTHQADSYLKAALPKDGTYYLHLYDAQNQGGPEYAYRLRVSQPRPDFELRVVPSAVNVRPGASAVITVQALRRDGFDGAILVGLKDAPNRFRISGGLIPAGQPEARMTISAPFDAQQSPIELRAEGRAEIGGATVRHNAVPADDAMQAFYYHHLVPAEQFLLALVERPRGVPLNLAVPPAVKLPAGGAAKVRFAGATRPIFQSLQFALSEPPDGISMQKAAPSADGLDIVLRADTAKIKPGWKGNLIFEAFTLRTVQPQKGPSKTVTRRISLGFLPAMPVEVVAQVRQ
jgi:hypothetical protein